MPNPHLFLDDFDLASVGAQHTRHDQHQQHQQHQPPCGNRYSAQPDEQHNDTSAFGFDNSSFWETTSMSLAPISGGTESALPHPASASASASSSSSSSSALPHPLGNTSCALGKRDDEQYSTELVMKFAEELFWKPSSTTATTSSGSESTSMSQSSDSSESPAQAGALSSQRDNAIFQNWCMSAGFADTILFTPSPAKEHTAMLPLTAPSASALQSGQTSQTRTAPTIEDFAESSAFSHTLQPGAQQPNEPPMLPYDDKFEEIIRSMHFETDAGGQTDFLPLSLGCSGLGDTANPSGGSARQQESQPQPPSGQPAGETSQSAAHTSLQQRQQQPAQHASWRPPQQRQFFSPPPAAPSPSPAARRNSSPSLFMSTQKAPTRSPSHPALAVTQPKADPKQGFSECELIAAYLAGLGIDFGKFTAQLESLETRRLTGELRFEEIEQLEAILNLAFAAAEAARLIMQQETDLANLSARGASLASPSVQNMLQSLALLKAQAQSPSGAGQAAATNAGSSISSASLEASRTSSSLADDDSFMGSGGLQYMSLVQQQQQQQQQQQEQEQQQQPHKMLSPLTAQQMQMAVPAQIANLYSGNPIVNAADAGMSTLPSRRRSSTYSSSESESEQQDFDATSSAMVTPTSGFEANDAGSSATSGSQPADGQQEAAKLAKKKRMKRPYICPIPECGRSYRNPAGIRYHLHHGHGPLAQTKKPFRCPVKCCCKRYTTDNSLRHHIVQSHMNADFPEQVDYLMQQSVYLQEQERLQYLTLLQEQVQMKGFFVKMDDFDEADEEDGGESDGLPSTSQLMTVSGSNKDPQAINIPTSMILSKDSSMHESADARRDC